MSIEPGSTNLHVYEITKHKVDPSGTTIMCMIILRTDSKHRKERDTNALGSL
jgi:hypothetical protein